MIPASSSSPTVTSAANRFWKAIRNPFSVARSVIWRFGHWSDERWWNRKRTSPARRTILLAEGGEKLRIYSDSILCRLITKGHFEIVEQRLLRAYLRPGDVFLDIGSNIGLFAVIAARIVGPQGSVHAFEPSAVTFERLQENIRLNRLTNVLCNSVAVSRDETPLTLYQSTDGYDAWNSAAAPLGGTSHRATVCRTITLNTYVEKLAVRPTLIKIDVEGWELNVLAGGAVALGGTESPDLLVEFTEQNCAWAGTDARALFRAIEHLGYQLFHVDEDLAMRPATEQDDFAYCNLFCTKDRTAAESRIASACAAS